jgi:hypothetical protein
MPTAQRDTEPFHADGNNVQWPADAAYNKPDRRKSASLIVMVFFLTVLKLVGQ